MAQSQTRHRNGAVIVAVIVQRFRQRQRPKRHLKWREPLPSSAVLWDRTKERAERDAFASDPAAAGNNVRL